MQKSPKVFSADQSLTARLNKRTVAGALRKLDITVRPIDFCSNDYLGFARSPELKEQTASFPLSDRYRLNGSTGSRLLSGNCSFAEAVEYDIAQYHQAPAGLIFNSGYDANVGFFSAVPAKGDTVLYDELIHASVRDGIRLSFADAFSFRHNDLNHLTDRLKHARGNVFIAVESIYSMDGDHAPLKALAAVCNGYGAHLVVDEAHATGIIGSGGRGAVAEAGIEAQCFARIHTFGKALGCHGAIVLGSDLLKNFMINFSRPLIYTTALSTHSLVAIKCAYTLLEKSGEKMKKLQNLIQLYQAMLSAFQGVGLSNMLSPIQCIMIPGNKAVRNCAASLQQMGFDVRPILSPTVKQGKERLRICLHSFNTEHEIKGLLQAIQTISQNIHTSV